MVSTQVAELGLSVPRRWQLERQIGFGFWFRLACQLLVQLEGLAAWLRLGQLVLALVLVLVEIVVLVVLVGIHKVEMVQEVEKSLVQMEGTSLVVHHIAFQDSLDQEDRHDPIQQVDVGKIAEDIEDVEQMEEDLPVDLAVVGSDFDE
jgi:hypothetical protein